MRLKEIVAADNAKLLEARAIFNEARKDFESKSFMLTIKQNKWLNQFMDFENNKLRADHDCCNCRPKYYTNANFTPDGITLWTDADHPNDRREHDFTWEEVEEVITI